MPYVLAIDVGTSSTRAGLYGAAGGSRRAGHAQRKYAVATTPEGGAELDADVLVDIVCQAIDEVLARSGDARIAAVATCTFWHSLIGVDRQGRAITPVLVWLDARSRADAARLRAELDERRVHARTGCSLHWSYWPAKLAWLRRTRPEVFARAARWVSFGEYLHLRLLGDSGVSASMASGTGLLELESLRWSEELLQASGLSADHLSPLVPFAPAGAALDPSFARRWPRLRGVPWLPAVGDGGVSNVGAGCGDARFIALMVGTSGAMRVVDSRAELAVPVGLWSYRLDETRRVVGGALNDGGSLFAWLRRSLRLPSARSLESTLAAMEPDAHGLTVLPFWGGERSPGWAEDARGLIHGLRLHTRPEEIVRASLEAVALRFGAIHALLDQSVPDEAQVVATGGALVASPAWTQILADVLERPVLVSGEREASSRGAALLAAEAMGLLRKPIAELEPRPLRLHRPVPEHAARYREAFERQRVAYAAVVRRESLDG